MGAKGCYYCPGDATCQNSNLYTSQNKVLSCNTPDDYWSGGIGGVNPATQACVSPDSVTQDPLEYANRWAHDMINVVPVWQELGYTGKGIVVRINDDGLDPSNPEFEGKFSAANSCPRWQPSFAEDPTFDDGAHGTAVAGIAVGNAGNDYCAAGIAYGASFSACNMFAMDAPLSNLVYKVETFDISQNSFGLP